MEFIIYNLKVAVCITIFFVFYKLLMSKETLHRLNRILLLLGAVVSFLLPLFVVTFHKVLPIVAGEVEIVKSSLLEIENDGTFLWQKIFVAIYILGALFAFVKFIIAIFQIVKIVKNSKRREQRDGYTLVVVDRKIVPFSWFGYVVVGSEDFDENLNIILQHEKAHITLYHSFDLLLLNLLSCVQWFNPTIWLLKNELRDIHEYEADKTVLENGIDAKIYQLLLIKKAVGKKCNSVANSLNHSKLKKRITMMLQKKSSKWVGTKAFYVVPLIAIAIMAFSQTVYSYNTIDGKNSEKNSDKKIELNRKPVADSTSLDIKFDDKSTLSVKCTNENGDSKPLVIVNGKVIEYTELSKISPEKIASISVIKKPYNVKKYGEKGKNGVIIVKLKDAKGHKQNQAKAYDKVDKKPEYPGGESALFAFFGKNIKYPATLKEKSGMALCKFIIRKDGSIGNVKIQKSSGYEAFDQEAIRVIKLMPKWTPGEMKGKVVKVKYLIPIKFKAKQ